MHVSGALQTEPSHTIGQQDANYLQMRLAAFTGEFLPGAIASLQAIKLHFWISDLG